VGKTHGTDNGHNLSSEGAEYQSDSLGNQKIFMFPILPDNYLLPCHLLFIVP
jgi:hypothetical protein